MILDKSSWLGSRPWLDMDNPDIGAYVRACGGEPSFDLERALRTWYDDGVVLFEGVVDKQLIDALLRDIDYLRLHFRDFDLLVEVRGAQKHIRDLSAEELELSGLKFNSIHTISMAAARLSLTREVSLFLRHVLQGPAVAMQSLTFYKGSQQPIHIDYPYVRCQSRLAHLAASWTPLEDIHPDSGPLAYYPGSHRVDVSEFFDWGSGSVVLEPDSERTPVDLSQHLNDRVRLKGIAPRIYCPRKGDVLVWHGNLSHEGTRIADERLTRKSYVTHYTSLEAYPKAHLKAGAPDSDWISRENGGYVFEYSWQDKLRQLPST
jgi:hypothetical protein